MKDELIDLLVRILKMCGNIFPSSLKTDTYGVIQILFESNLNNFGL